MPGKETAARIRALTRQVTSLKDELHREAKRSAWAMERVKEKERIVKSLENKAEEAACVNSRLMLELKTTEEAQKTANDLKEAEIQKLMQTSKQHADEATAKRDMLNDQLMHAATEIFRLENAISARGSSDAYLGTACIRKLEAALARVGQRLLTIKDGVQTKTDSPSISDSVGLNEKIGMKSSTNEKDSNVRKILVAYRTSMSRLREQISRLEKDNQQLIQKIRDLEEGTAALKTRAQEVECTKQQTARFHEAEREKLTSTIQTLRGTCDARLQRIGELEKDVVGFQSDKRELEATVLKQEQRVRSLEAYIARQKREMTEGLKLLSNSKAPPLDVDIRIRHPLDAYDRVTDDRISHPPFQTSGWNDQSSSKIALPSPSLAKKDPMPLKTCVNDFDVLDNEIRDMEAKIQRAIES